MNAVSHTLTTPGAHADGSPALISKRPGERQIAVDNVLAEVLPDGLQQGVTIAVHSTSTTLLLVSATTRQEGWVGIVGLPALSLAAAEELGVDLDHCVLVPAVDSSQQPTVVASLLDAVDLVVVGNAESIRPAMARQLMARARRSGAVLVLHDCGWVEGPLFTIESTVVQWVGPERGYGRLEGRWIELHINGRGAYSRTRSARIWLGNSFRSTPGPDESARSAS